MGKFIDISGKTFSRLTVVGKSGKNSKGETLWECRCLCGNIVHITGGSLRSGNTKSCGCYKRERQIEMNKARIKDISGQTFGRLTAIRIYKGEHNWKRERVFWECKCSCGNTMVADGSLLRMGRVKSCGCLMIDTNTTHGGTYKPEYRIWCGIRDRCSNPKRKDYKYYGGEGIKCCKRWEKFENFYEDMGQRPSKKYSVDRKNPWGDYEPSNCRWATRREQAINKRKNIYIYYDRNLKTISEWAAELNISPAKMEMHVNNRDVEDVFAQQKGEIRSV